MTKPPVNFKMSLKALTFHQPDTPQIPVPPPPTRPPSAPPPELAEISGCVQDNFGTPLAQVTIILVQGGDDIIAETKTNAAGKYKFTNVDPGTYEIVELNPASHPITVTDYDTTPDGDIGEDDTTGDDRIAVTVVGGREGLGKRIQYRDYAIHLRLLVDYARDMMFHARYRIKSDSATITFLHLALSSCLRSIFSPFYVSSFAYSSPANSHPALLRAIATNDFFQGITRSNRFGCSVIVSSFSKYSVVQYLHLCSSFLLR